MDTSRQTESKIYLLIKIFDKEEYADAFINQGEMFCRTLGQFRQTEDDKFRGDAYEGVTDWHQPDNVKLTISYKDINGVDHSIELKEKELAGPVIIQGSGFDCLNLFCMYAIKIHDFEEIYETEEERLKVVGEINRSLNLQVSLDEKASALGDFAVLVYRVAEFIHKVRDATNQIGAECVGGLVKYYDPKTFNGSFGNWDGVFRKRTDYEHQNEFRFAFLLPEQQRNGAKTIRVGPLTDIALKLPTKEINSRVQINFKELNNNQLPR